MTVQPAAILASGSPRRALILQRAGVKAQIVLPALDDADAPTDMRDPCAHVMSLAWFKARLVLGQISQGQVSGDPSKLPRWLIAADTMCVLDGRILGKASDAQELRGMLRSFQGRAHEVVTGVCIVDRTSGGRRLFFDSASVHLGELNAGEVDRYADSNEWQGKAGGYNYQDRLEAGWPLRCDGDPETVMGLPSRLVLPAIGAAPIRPKGTA
ncbi:MAG: Maf-like protein [Phycisphaerae bacterium]|nr:Maf-like protein [Phycisphaerae bacterium]